MRTDPDLMEGTFIDECMRRLGAQETLARCYYKNKARVAIFREKKTIPRSTEQTEIWIHSVGNPYVSRNEKLSEFCSKPFRYVEEKTTRNFIISFRTIPRKIKMLGILFQIIWQKKKTLGISLTKEKNFWKLVPN